VKGELLIFFLRTTSDSCRNCPLKPNPKENSIIKQSIILTRPKNKKGGQAREKRKISNRR
jgi:hypothetical protein